MKRTLNKRFVVIERIEVTMAHRVHKYYKYYMLICTYNVHIVPMSEGGERRYKTVGLFASSDSVNHYRNKDDHRP